MNNSISIESIFSTALEKRTAPERSDYLDRACGTNAALRRQVERLLEANRQAENFLARPAVDRRQYSTDLARAGLDE